MQGNILEKVKEQCDKQNISISALEKKAGIGNGTIARWGDSVPNLSSLAKAAEALGVSIEYFLKP